METQKVERGQHRLALLGLASTSPAGSAPIHDALWTGDGDEDGAYRLPFLRVWTRYASYAETVVGVEQLAHGAGHGTRGFSADDAILLDGFAWYSHLNF